MKKCEGIYSLIGKVNHKSAIYGFELLKEENIHPRQMPLIIHLKKCEGCTQKELAEKICQRVDNHSSYVQQLAWLVWIHTDKVATEQDFEEAYQDIIDQNTPLFEKQTESLTTYQMNFLRAILDGVHSEFTTQEILQKYKLGSSANVSIVKRALVKKELIEIEKRKVIIPDPVMKVWLKKELGGV